MSVTVTLVGWNAVGVKGKAMSAVAAALNKAATDGVTYAQMIAPRDTGFMANTIEVLKRATPQDASVEWGNITAAYTLWQEIGARGQPGKYFLRSSLDRAGGQGTANMANKL